MLPLFSSFTEIRTQYFSPSKMKHQLVTVGKPCIFKFLFILMSGHWPSG